MNQSPFDTMADSYDVDFTNTMIGRLQRRQVWESLKPVLESYPGPVKILEINCGTGEDAVKLSRAGHYVTATDGSAMMIEKAKQKAIKARTTHIRFEVCSFNELHTRFEGEKFGLVISNFGGLNCIDRDEIKQLGLQLLTLLEDGGKLFFVIMGRFCLWEILYYLGRGKIATAFRRKRKSVIFRHGNETMPVFYYSPANLKMILHSSYTYCRCVPVGLFIPPSYLENKFKSRQWWLDYLGRLERKFSSYPVLSNLADHFCITFKKNGSL